MAWKITDLDGTFSLLSVGAIMPQNPNSLCQLNLLNIPCRWRHPGKEQKRLQKDGGTERKFWDKCPDSFSFLSFLRDLLLLYTPSTTMARSLFKVNIRTEAATRYWGCALHKETSELKCCRRSLQLSDNEIQTFVVSAEQFNSLSQPLQSEV